MEVVINIMVVTKVVVNTMVIINTKLVINIIMGVVHQQQLVFMFMIMFK